MRISSWYHGSSLPPFVVSQELFFFSLFLVFDCIIILCFRHEVMYPGCPHSSLQGRTKMLAPLLQPDNGAVLTVDQRTPLNLFHLCLLDNWSFVISPRESVRRIAFAPEPAVHSRSVPGTTNSGTLKAIVFLDRLQGWVQMQVRAFKCKCVVSFKCKCI